MPTLEPLAYHRLIVEHLRENKSEIWAWGGSRQVRGDQVQEMRAYLFRETYRLGDEAHPEVHADCVALLAKLEIAPPITLYRAADGAMNASLCYVPGEIHLMFHGPVLEKLSREERVALLGHELAHYRLWSIEGGVFFTASTVLDHALAYPDAASSYVETARLFRLYTELYADRGGAVAADAAEPAIATLVKTMTGLTAVDAKAYLRQAVEAEIDAAASQDQTHPEIFLCAQALDRWWRGEPEIEAWIEKRIRGALSLAVLDLSRQHEATALTRGFLTRLGCASGGGCGGERQSAPPLFSRMAAGRGGDRGHRLGTRAARWVVLRLSRLAQHRRRNARSRRPGCDADRRRGPGRRL